MIESQVEEVRTKIQLDIKESEINMKKQDLHGKLSEQQLEYQEKMKIIEEINRDKLRQEE